MPNYTRPWTYIASLGSIPARLIDDILRDLRVDIDERMRDLVVDWDADPVTLPQSITAIISAKRYTYTQNNAQGFRASSRSDLLSLLSYYFEGETTGSGVININISALQENWDINSSLNIAIVPARFLLYDVDDNDYVVAKLESYNTVSKVMTFTVRRVTGTIAANSTVRGYLFLYLITKPS